MNLNKYKEAQEKVSKARREAQEVMKEAFKEGCQELFNKYPILESFSWRQYTDYFNDGDTCNFHVHAEDYGLYVNDLGRDEIYDGTQWKVIDGKYQEVSIGDPHPLTSISNEITSFVYSFDSDDLKEMFDDHSEIKVSKLNNEIKIDVESYTSHD